MIVALFLSNEAMRQSRVACARCFAAAFLDMQTLCMTEWPFIYLFIYFFLGGGGEATLLTKHNSETTIKLRVEEGKKRVSEERWEQKREEEMRAEEGRGMGA